MKRFKVTVTRIDEYEIEIDESVFDDAWKKDFEESFWPIKGPETIAENLAGIQARFGSDMDFIEGYGYVQRNGKLPFSFEDYKDGKLLPENERREPAPGLNINILDEDNNIHFEIYE